MSVALSFSRRHTGALIHIGLGVAVVILGSAAFAIYEWVFKFASKTACIPQALKVFEWSLALFGGLFVMLLMAAFVGNWADRQTGWTRWSLISLIAGVIAYAAYVKILLPEIN